MMLAMLNFLERVNFTDQLVYRSEIKLLPSVSIKAAVKCHRFVVFP